MHKPLYILLFATFSLLFTGCIKDNLDDCPASIFLMFNYQADGEDNVIDTYIHSGQLFVYDQSTKLVDVLPVSASQLKNGLSLNLPFGEYTIVCWGNAETQTEITHEEELQTARLNAPGYYQNTQIFTNDALYHGTLDLSVAQTTRDHVRITETLDFNAAHINLEVYVRYKTEPTIQVHHLMPQYDFKMGNTQPFETDYTPTVSYIEKRKAYAALLNVLRFDNDNPITVEVDLPGGLLTSPVSIHLKEFMEEQTPALTVEGRQEVTISVLIEFTDLGVTCKIPEWIVEEGYPGIE